MKIALIRKTINVLSCWLCARKCSICSFRWVL